MPRETFILTQDIAAGQIIDSHTDPTSNIGKLAAKKVIDTVLLTSVAISGTTTRLDQQLLDFSLAVLPTDLGVLVSKQHALYSLNSANGLDDGSGTNRVRGSLSSVAPITSPVTMTIGTNVGVAAVPSNFVAGDLVRIEGQGLTSTYLAEVLSVVGPNLTFVEPGTVNPKLFIEAGSGTYNMERCRRWLMSWITAAMAPFAVPAASYDIGIFRRAYLADVNALNAPTIYPLEAESPQLPGSGGGSVPPTRLISTTPPLQGGGDLSADRTLSVDDATALAKGVIQLAGDLAGTAAAPTVPGKAPITRQINTTPPLQGGGDLTADRTLSISVDPPAAPTVVGTTRQINTTAPLQGGGDLSVDRTLSVDDATTLAKGVVQLAGDLAGTAAAPTVPALATKVPDTRQIIAGAGMTGGGDLTADRTLDVVANADGSIVVNPNDIQVGVLATDAQHGVRGGGTQHAVATPSVAGFMSAADKAKLDAIHYEIWRFGLLHKVG